MGYTARKIRSINRSFFLAGFVFAAWALVCAWQGWPHSLRHGSAAAFALFLCAALFFCAFPIVWARYPEKHPVNHALRRYGNFRQLAQRLDAEMAEQPVEIEGPFRFTLTMLVYDSGHEFQMVPYSEIKSAATAAEDDAPSLIVQTKHGRRYQWYPSWMQGKFDPKVALQKLRKATHLEAECDLVPTSRRVCDRLEP